MSGILCQILRRVLKLFHIRLSDDQLISVLQFIKFGVVGVSNTIISYGLNVLTLLVLRPIAVSWDYILGNIIAFLLSVLWSFYWNNRFVFAVQGGKRRALGKTLLKTYIAYGFTGIILNNFLSWLWISVIGISKYIAPLINLIVSVPLNFVINKFWAFKQKD